MANSRNSQTDLSGNTDSRQELNFDNMNSDEVDALIELYYSSEKLMPEQACMDQYQLPASMPITVIDPAKMTEEHISLIHDTYLNYDAQNNHGLSPNNHYLSLARFKIHGSTYFKVRLISVTHFIPIKFINPSENSEESNTILFDFLTKYNMVGIFLPNKLYLDIKKLGLISFANYIVKYKREKNSSIDRYAISDNEIGDGVQGVVYKSSYTLIIKADSILIKRKSDEKERIIKFGDITNILRVTENIHRHAIHHEYVNMSLLPSLFHPKQNIDDMRNSLSAVISRFFTGKDLDETLFGENPVIFSPQQRMALCSKLAKALRKFHQHGIIHRDLKLENIVVRLDPTNNDIIDVNYIDLGLSISVAEAIIGGGTNPGTPIYAPPEAWACKNATPASDIFTLGRIFWQIMSGKHIDDIISADDAKEAIMPDLTEIFDYCDPNDIHPLYIQSAYYLLMRMNAYDPAERIAIDTVIKNLDQIMELVNSHLLSSINNDDTAAKAAASTTGLFSTAQSASTASTCSDDFYTSMPTINTI